MTNSGKLSNYFQGICQNVAVNFQKHQVSEMVLDRLVLLLKQNSKHLVDMKVKYMWVTNFKYKLSAFLFKNVGNTTAYKGKSLLQQLN